MSAQQQNIRVRLFAVARQLAGCDALEMKLAEGATIADLRRALAERAPALAAVLPHVLFSVNAEYAANDRVIPLGAEVACIPPVSGG